MPKTLIRLVAAGLAVIALSGCDPTTWSLPHKPPDGTGLTCHIYWPDGHTGCQP